MGTLSDLSVSQIQEGETKQETTRKDLLHDIKTVGLRCYFVFYKNFVILSSVQLQAFAMKKGKVKIEKKVTIGLLLLQAET